MANIKGAGGFFTRETDGTLRMLRTATFQLTSEAEQTDVQAFPYDKCGPLQIVDSFIPSKTWGIAVAPTSVDRSDLELLLDKKFATATSIVLPEPIGLYTLPATGAQEITIAGLAANDVVSVTLLDDTNGNTPLLPADYTVAAGKITIAAVGSEGKSAAVYRRKTNTAIKVIGGNTAGAEIGDVEIMGLICTTRGNFKFWAPRAKRSNGVDFAIDSDSFTLEYKLLVPTSLGWSNEFAVW
jgi:hypothetical protein